MCCDLRKARADALVKAWQERMRARDEAQAKLLPGECPDPDCWCHEMVKMMPLPPGDGPGPTGDVALRAYATDNDGFAGSILARREANRERLDRYQRELDEWIARKEAGEPWWVNVILAAIVCGIGWFVIDPVFVRQMWPALVAPPDPGGQAPPLPPTVAPGPPHAPGGLVPRMPDGLPSR